MESLCVVKDCHRAAKASFYFEGLFFSIGFVGLFWKMQHSQAQHVNQNVFLKKNCMFSNVFDIAAGPGDDVLILFKGGEAATQKGGFLLRKGFVNRG